MLAPIFFVTLVVAQPSRTFAEFHRRAYAAALLNKDLRWFAFVSAPNFTFESQGRPRLNRKQWLEELKTRFGMVTVLSVKSKVLKVAPKGAGVAITWECDETVRFTPAKYHYLYFHSDAKATPPEPIKPSSRYRMVTRYEEFWSMTGNDWKIHVQKATSNKTTVEGSPAK